ncbi:hypothetical protein [Mycobacterium sp. E796]|uniref:hypothetical protein n=1 Tax=Mycobacterium sp. E796 TaxID=1834151 RepID=UPI000AA6B0A9|nr:hypothetical protein [Mycobacterium sp. E796]
MYSIAQREEAMSYPTQGALGQGRSVARPGTVIAAGVVAFLFAPINVINGLVVLARGMLLAIFYLPARAVGAFSSIVAGLMILAIAVSLIWGAVATLKGRTNKILFWASLAAAVCYVAIASVIYALGGSPYWVLLLALCAALPAGIIVLVLTHSSKDFFRARGGAAI